MSPLSHENKAACERRWFLKNVCGGEDSPHLRLDALPPVEFWTNINTYDIWEMKFTTLPIKI